MAHPANHEPTCRVHRGAVLNYHSDPGGHDAPGSFEYFEDGALLVDGSSIAAVGPAPSVLRDLPAGIPVINHGDDILMPGFIDTHIHYPQTDVIASGGRQLLDWLRDYTFPHEAQFAEPGHAREVAEFFLNELIRNGTTTALVFCTVHRTSVEAFFEAAARRSMRMIAGKVLMDRHSPDNLRDSAAEGERETRELIEAWHGRDRLHYAITPRFAPTSTEEQLRSAGQLAREYPDVFIQTHIAENRDEIAWVKQLFPASRDYVDVYEQHGLLRDKTVYAHCIHLSHDERARMAQAGAAAAFCPTSNLYLGSGLFDMAATDAAGLRFSIATDVGGGTSFSLLRTMSEAYKVAQLTGQRLSPVRAFYLATLGGARSLGLEARVGRFAPGLEADFNVINPNATPILARRMAQSHTLSEKLLVLMTLGDDRAIRQTYILGRRAHYNPLERCA